CTAGRPGRNPRKGNVRLPVPVVQTGGRGPGRSRSARGTYRIPRLHLRCPDFPILDEIGKEDGYNPSGGGAATRQADGGVGAGGGREGTVTRKRAGGLDAFRRPSRERTHQVVR